MKQTTLLIFLITTLLLGACNQNKQESNEQTNNNSVVQQDTIANELPSVGDLVIGNFKNTYKGSINNNYAIEVELLRFDSDLYGSYSYEGKKGSLSLRGSLEDTGEIIFTEYNSKGETTGSFEGKMKEDQITGTWYNKNKTKSMPFSLTQASSNLFSSKTDVLNDAIGTFTLQSIAGHAGANAMFDTYMENGKWRSFGSGINAGMREGYEITLTSSDTELLKGLHIKVDDQKNIHLFAGSTELITCPFNTTGMNYQVNETDKTKMHESIAALSASTITRNNEVLILANDHMDFSDIIKGTFEIVAADNMILTYYPAQRKFELHMFVGSCCDGSILTFAKK